MNPWPFVAGAYAVVILSTAGLVLWAFGSMHRAERAADKLKRK